MRRAWAARRAEPGSALERYLAAPPPEISGPVTEARLLALDLETTGLEPARDQILAVGFVPVDGDEIVLSGARDLLVRPEGEVGQSAVVHGLTDDVVAGGAPLREVLDEVLDALTGRTLLAHYSPLETGFLAAACKRVYGASLPLQAVDTLELQRRLVSTPYDDPRGGTLRLAAARDHHGLPRYTAHAALTDALACAELYLAQQAAFVDRGVGTVKTLLR